MAEVPRHDGAAAAGQVLGRGANHAEGGQDAVDPPRGAAGVVAEHRHAHPGQPQGVVELRPGLANLCHRPGGPGGFVGAESVRLGLGPAGVGQQASVELPRGGAGEDLNDDRLPRLEVLDLGD